MIESRSADSPQAFAPLAPLLRAIPPEKLSEARRRLAKLDRTALLHRYRTAFADGRHLAAFILAGELVERGIPPCFWRQALALDNTSITQRYYLARADLAWLRRWHRDHAKAVRYQRGKALLTGSDTVFHREAEFAFYQGKRPAWKQVASLSMTERQQWECAWLRSAPINKRAGVTEANDQRVLQALQDDLRTVRRTAAFGEAEIQATLARRHAIWRCARMVEDASPTEIATRYTQMTGSPLSRQAAANQLEKVRTVLKKVGMTL